jgi:nuclear transcription Y subunit beta
MKRILPNSAKMTKEAKAAIQEATSEFIAFVTSEASERLVEDKRKTITGDDGQPLSSSESFLFSCPFLLSLFSMFFLAVIESMKSLGFDAYVSFLQIYLQKYREVCLLLLIPVVSVLLICPPCFALICRVQKVQER